MNIFISWSGERSHKVALLLKDWIKGIIQAARPWVSSEDIGSGTRWFAQISDQIEATSQGIICITSENRDKPWILFEAGALSKGQTTSVHVTPLLIDLEKQDITGPLAQFNAVIASKEEDMRKLVLDLNKRLPAEAIVEEAVLNRLFTALWPDFAKDFSKAVAETQADTPKKVVRKEDSILAEILDLVRSLDKRVTKVEVADAKSQARQESKPDELTRLRAERDKRVALQQVAKDTFEQGASDEQVESLLKKLMPDYPNARVIEILDKAKDALGMV